MTRTRLTLVLAIIALLPGRARADDGHYQNFLVGELAAGMGGAYTAIASDPSGTYYNPAGLVDVGTGTLSTSLDFYGFQQQSLSNALHVPSGNVVQSLTNSLSAAVSQLNTVPGSAGASHGIGRQDSQGRYHQAWALSILVPDDTSGSSLTDYVDPSGHLQSLSQTSQDLTTLIGVGYGYRYDDRWSFGASITGMYRQITRNSRVISALGYSSTAPSQQFFEDDISLKLAALGLYAQVGALYHWSSKLTFGATLATPSLTVFSNASSDEVLTGAQSSVNGLNEIYQASLTGDTRWPVHGRLGAAWQAIPDLFIALDVSVWGVVHYGLINFGSSGASANQRLPNFVNDITREPTFNVDVGAQYVVAHKVPVRLGFFTNFSSAPDIDLGPEPQLDQVNLYGVTLGFTLNSQHTESTFGLTCSFGNGQTKTPTAVESSSSLTYAPGPANQLFLDLFAGGSYRF